MAKKNKAEQKQMATRIVCLALVVIMVGSVLISAVLSQVF